MHRPQYPQTQLRSSVMYGGNALCDAVIAPCVVRLLDVFGITLEFGAKYFCIASGDSAHAIV